MRHRAPKLLVASLAAATIALTATACGAAPATRPTTAVPHYRHVVVVVMENLSYNSAWSTPGFAKLARKFAYDSDAYAVSHPSLPNYLALVAGSTFGIHEDCTGCYIDASNLGEQLSTAGLRWDDFSQDLPSKCFLGAFAGEYAAKHNPFRYFDDIRQSKALCGHLLPLGPLLTDLKRPASSLPAFSFVTPNLCYDGHNCSAPVAAKWLTGFLGKVTASKAWSSTLVLVTWDESVDADTASISPSGAVAPTGGGGHILVLVCAKGIAKGTMLTTPLNQEGILAYVEQNFSLPLLAGAASWSGHTLSIP